MRSLARRSWILIVAGVALLGAAGALSWRLGWLRVEDDDEREEVEERDRERDHFWRVQIAIRGAGTVNSVTRGVACESDAERTRGECGPKLLRFKELSPPLLEAKAAQGWRFARWESLTREADGALTPRGGPMPDGRYYLNGFGYADTGATETVTAVFVRDDP